MAGRMRASEELRSGLRTSLAAAGALGLALFSALTGGGCGNVQVRESEVESTLSTKVIPIVVGESDLTAVRRLLGEPWLHSDFWQFDLFRVTDRATAVAVMIVPVWVDSDTVNGYVLVSYDERGTVSGRDAGVVEGDNISGRSFVASAGSSSTLISAGEVTFTVDAFEQTPSVYVSTSRRDEFLEQSRRSDSQCLLVLGCVGSFCETGIAVDGGPPLALPGAYLGHPASDGAGTEFWRQLWLAPIALVPGAHRIVVVPPKMATLEAATELRCAAGEVLFAAIDVRRAEGMRWKMPLEGEIRISRGMPESLQERPLVIWRDGAWLVPAEPGR
jgi:hypothetical protein